MVDLTEAQTYALEAAHVAAKVSVASQVSYDDALEALMRIAGYVPVTEGHDVLDVKTTSQGLKYFEPVKGHFENGKQVCGSVEVGESSCAFPPSIYVEAHDHGGVRDTLGVAYVQLDLDAASLLRDQLTWLIDNHYQVKPREQDG